VDCVPFAFADPLFLVGLSKLHLRRSQLGSLKFLVSTKKVFHQNVPVLIIMNISKQYLQWQLRRSLRFAPELQSLQKLPWSISARSSKDCFALSVVLLLICLCIALIGVFCCF